MDKERSAEVKKGETAVPGRAASPNFFEIAGTGTAGWKIEEIKIPVTSAICGKTLRDLALRQTANVSIAAIISPDGKFQLNPQGDTTLVAESTLIAVGWQADIQALEGLVVGG